MKNSTKMNAREEAYRRKAYNECAGHYLCDPDTEDQENGIKDCYDQYLLLLAESEKGNGHDIANYVDGVTVWEPLEYHTVDTIINLIESSMPVENDNLPPHVKNIDWELLKKQKLALLTVIEYFENNKLPVDFTDALTGILHMINSLQDDAVDIYGLEEDTVFQFTHE